MVKKFTALIAVPLIEAGSNSLMFAYITLLHEVRNPIKKNNPAIIKREGVGKKYSNLLRKEDKVPCVLYGGKENIHFTAHENAFRNIVYTPNVYVIKLGLNGKEYNAIMQDIQFHPESFKIM